MKRLLICILVCVLILVGIGADVVLAESVTQTEVSKYALSWADNKNIPYVFGGPGRSMGSLEEVASKKAGLDCSGFTMLVYKHFGIDIPSSSSTQKSKAKKVFTDITKAVPGDVVYWEGHVAIYIGNEKIVHTNTKRPSTNYPHVSSVYYNKKEKPTFLRMVDDVSKLKPLSGSTASDVDNSVQNAETTGSIVTESDLTGMPTESSLGSVDLELPTYDTLSNTDKNRLEDIKTSIIDREGNVFDILYSIVSGIGLGVIVYGVLLVVAYIFDRVNTLLELSLLSILTLGRYRIWDENLGVKPGYDKSSNKMYCNTSVIIKRFIIIEVVGFFLIGNYIFRILYNFIIFISKYL